MAILLMLLSVNLDSLGVGFSYGVRAIHIPFGSIALMSSLSVVYSYVALFAGSLLIHILPPWASKTLGIAILLIMGVMIIVNAFRKTDENCALKKERKTGTLFSWGIKPLGITISIVRNPTACDFDNSNRIDAKEAIYLGLALSLDAIGVGLGCALGGLRAYYIPLLVGLSQLVLLSIGLAGGRALTKHVKIDERVWSVLSGVLLIILALMRI